MFEQITEQELIDYFKSLPPGKEFIQDYTWCRSCPVATFYKDMHQEEVAVIGSFVIDSGDFNHASPSWLRDFVHWVDENRDDTPGDYRITAGKCLEFFGEGPTGVESSRPRESLEGDSHEAT